MLIAKPEIEARTRFADILGLLESLNFPPVLRIEESEFQAEWSADGARNKAHKSYCLFSIPIVVEKRAACLSGGLAGNDKALRNLI